jgi:hypothetical protein
MRRKRSAPALPTAVESLHAVFLQAVAKIAEMLFVSRFHRAEDMDGGNIGTGKSAVDTTCLMLPPVQAICAVRSAMIAGSA